MFLVHGTCVDVEGVGVLLRGPSGAGKSDLALRLIDGGARLVADDQVALARDGAEVRPAAPATIAGLIEVRGLGPIRLEATPGTPLLLVVDLVQGPVERMPEPEFVDLLGVAVPLLRLNPFEASAAAKVRLAAGAAARGLLPAA